MAGPPRLPQLDPTAEVQVDHRTPQIDVILADPDGSRPGTVRMRCSTSDWESPAVLARIPALDVTDRRQRLVPAARPACPCLF